MKYYLIIGLGVWLHAADSLVTATLAPAVVSEFGGVAYVNWLITLYEAGAVVSGAAIAAACQRYGLKRAFLAGALVYCIGCMVAAISANMAMILSGRLLQGLGGGALLASAAPATLQRIGYAVGTAFAGVLANMSGLADGVQAASARVAGFWVFAGFVPLLLFGIKYGWRFTRA
jgi:MFS family permease